MSRVIVHKAIRYGKTCKGCTCGARFADARELRRHLRKFA